MNHQNKSTAVIINRALIRKTPTAATLENGWFLARHTRAKVSAATSAPSRPPKTVTTTKKISHCEVLTRLRRNSRTSRADDPDAPALQRPDGTVVARFGARGMTDQAVEREALEDFSEPG